MKVRKNAISTVLGFMCCLGVVSASYSADWYTIDGGWCTLIYVPIPEDIENLQPWHREALRRGQNRKIRFW